MVGIVEYNKCENKDSDDDKNDGNRDETDTNNESGITKAMKRRMK